MQPSLFSIKGLSFGHDLAAPLAAAVVALSLVACSQSRESGSQGAGNEGSGEHGGMEGSGEHDGDGQSSEGHGEESATQYGPGDTYDVVRAGARLVLRSAQRKALHEAARVPPIGYRDNLRRATQGVNFARRSGVNIESRLTRERRTFRVTHPFHPLHGREFELGPVHTNALHRR